MNYESQKILKYTKSYQSPPLLLSLSSFFISFCFPLFNLDFICFSLLTIASKSRLMDFLTSDKMVSSLSTLKCHIPFLWHLSHDGYGRESTSMLHRQHQVTSPCLPHSILFTFFDASVTKLCLKY